VAIAPVVPQQVRYAGKLATRAGDTVEAVFRIYATEQGVDPLWTETQRVTVAEDGAYTVLLGGASAAGLPQTIFAGGAARWLGVSVEQGVEQDRVLLSSVPYAMKSADAESLAGHAASDFVTQEQLAQLAQSSAQAGQPGGATSAITPLTSGTVTGSGTSGTVPLWTGTLTQGNSEITQVGSDIGINEATPAATLDVGGTSMFRGTATLPAEATATTSAGYRSQLLDFSDSAWSTTTGAPVTHTWRIYATDSGNNSANPTSSLNFQFQNGAGAATPTILSIGQTGVISFAPTQTFPGTITSVTGSSPVTATTTSGAVSLGLNTSALETTLNGVYAGLGAGDNVFTGSASFAGPITAASNGPGGAVTAGSMTGPGLIGNSQSPGEGAAGILGYINTSPSASYTTVEAVGTAGVWGDANGTPGGADWSAGVIGTASSLVGYGGVFYNNSALKPTILAENATTGVGIDAISNGGSGVFGSSIYGSGVTGNSSTPNPGNAGVFGNSSGETSSSYSTAVGLSSLVAGVWGDSIGNPAKTAYSSAGIVGTATATLGYGGYFLNAAPSLAAVEAQNSLGPGLEATGNGSDAVTGYSQAGSGGSGTGGSGVYGVAVTPSAGNSGVLGLVYFPASHRAKSRQSGPAMLRVSGAMRARHRAALNCISPAWLALETTLRPVYLKMTAQPGTPRSPP